jgi:hypothetical protein
VQVARVPPVPVLPAAAAPPVPAPISGIERLFQHTGMTTLAGVVIAACVWLLFDPHRPSPAVHAWAVLIHAAQATMLMTLAAFRRAARPLASRRPGNGATASP